MASSAVFVVGHSSSKTCATGKLLPRASTLQVLGDYMVDCPAVSMTASVPLSSGKLSFSSAGCRRLAALLKGESSLSSRCAAPGFVGKSLKTKKAGGNTEEQSSRRVVAGLTGSRSAGAVHGSRTRKGRRVSHGTERPSGDEPDELLVRECSDSTAKLDDAGRNRQLPLTDLPYGDSDRDDEDSLVESEWNYMEEAMDDRERYMLEWGAEATRSPSTDKSERHSAGSSNGRFKGAELRTVASEADGTGSRVSALMQESEGRRADNASRDRMNGASYGPSTSGRADSATSSRRVARTAGSNSRSRRMTVLKVQRTRGCLVLQTTPGSQGRAASGSGVSNQPRGGREGAPQAAEVVGREFLEKPNSSGFGSVESSVRGAEAVAVSEERKRRDTGAVSPGTEKADPAPAAVIGAASMNGVAAENLSTSNEASVKEKSSRNLEGVPMKDSSKVLAGVRVPTAADTLFEEPKDKCVAESMSGVEMSGLMGRGKEKDGEKTNNEEEMKPGSEDVGSSDASSNSQLEKWEVEVDGKRPAWVMTSKEYKRMMRKQNFAEKKAEFSERKAKKVAEKEAAKADDREGKLEEVELVGRVGSERSSGETEGKRNLDESELQEAKGRTAEAEGGAEGTKLDSMEAAEAQVIADTDQKDLSSNTRASETSDSSNSETREISFTESVSEGGKNNGPADSEKKKKKKAEEEKKKKTEEEKKKKKKKTLVTFTAPAGRCLVVVRGGQLLMAGAGACQQTAALGPSGPLVAAGRGWLVEDEVVAGSELVGVVVDQLKETVNQVTEKVADILPPPVKQTTMKVADTVSLAAGDLKGQVAGLGRTVTDALPNVIVERVESLAEQVGDTVAQMAETVSDKVDLVTESVADTVFDLSETVADTVSDLADSVQETVLDFNDAVQDTVDAVQDKVDDIKGTVKGVAQDLQEQVQGTVGDLLLSEADFDEDELETFKTPVIPEFRGRRGMTNFTIIQESTGPLSILYDIYIYMLKVPFPVFAFAMFMVPVVLSLVFTVLYLPDMKGLALEETAEKFLAQKNFAAQSASGADFVGLQPNGFSFFQVYMFSLALSTGLQPELAPLSPYTLVIANVNALVAQLMFVFLSGAVFARLSQPSQPVKCSKVAVFCPPSTRGRFRSETARSVLMCRYVLTGPQPSELVDVKVDLTFKYNSLTRSGAYFRAQQSLKLVRPEIAYQTHGMLVRHVIDESSPLFRRTPEFLKQEDAMFSLSVVGLERSSMQSIFHVEHYSVVDGDVVWNAEFEDMVLITKKNKRIVDQRKLSNIKMT